MMQKIFSSLLFISLVWNFAIGAELKDIQIPLTSKHYDKNFHKIEGLNEDNQGFLVGIKTQLPVILKLGTFKNAYARQSAFFGIEKGYDLGYVEVGATGGLATGYDNPILAGFYIESSKSIGIFGTRLDFTYNPYHDVSTFAISLIYRFGDGK